MWFWGLNDLIEFYTFLTMEIQIYKEKNVLIFYTVVFRDVSVYTK